MFRLLLLLAWDRGNAYASRPIRPQIRASRHMLLPVVSPELPTCKLHFASIHQFWEKALRAGRANGGSKGVERIRMDLFIYAVAARPTKARQAAQRLKAKVWRRLHEVWGHRASWPDISGSESRITTREWRCGLAGARGKQFRFSLHGSQSGRVHQTKGSSRLREWLAKVAQMAYFPSLPSISRFWFLGDSALSHL